MRKWIREVAPADLQDGVQYFLARRPRTAMDCYWFLAENRKGARSMSMKPGLAVRVECGDELRAFLEKHADHCAIAIPADADRRWKMR